MQSVQTVTEF